MSSINVGRAFSLLLALSCAAQVSPVFAIDFCQPGEKQAAVDAFLPAEFKDAAIDFCTPVGKAGITDGTITDGTLGAPDAHPGAVGDPGGAVALQNLGAVLPMDMMHGTGGGGGAGKVMATGGAGAGNVMATGGAGAGKGALGLNLGGSLLPVQPTSRTQAANVMLTGAVLPLAPQNSGAPTMLPLTQLIGGGNKAAAPGVLPQAVLLNFSMSIQK